MRKNNNETYILGISRHNSRSRRTLKTGLTGTAENSSSLKVQTIRRSQQHFKNISVYTQILKHLEIVDSLESCKTKYFTLRYPAMGYIL
jgi:hypothetical protein